MEIDVGHESDGGAANWQAPPPALPRLRPATRRTEPRDAGASPLPPDLAFLAYDGIEFSVLYRAAERARAIGVPGHEALIASGAVSEARYLAALARRLGAEVLTSAVNVDASAQLDEAIRTGWCRAVAADGRAVIVVSRTGELMTALTTGRRLTGRSLVLAGADDFRALLAAAFSGEIALSAQTTVPAGLSARGGVGRGQKLAAVLVIAALATTIAVAPEALRLGLPLAFGLFFLGTCVVMLSSCIEGAPVVARHIERDDARLPRYTVLCPLYREVAVLDGLLAALGALDYPHEKIQILLVVEDHDGETLSALASRILPPHVGVFVAPPGAPHTKPRALNAAMGFTTGEMVVIYDAEDRPEPDQLRAAVASFAASPGDVVCFQARLAIDNTFDSWLTRLFTIEYAALFDVVKAGNARLGLPVPLGGTSNHFRVAELRRVGLWDAWNVTEDADLGIRLAAHGLLVGDLPSTTLEEAPNRLRPWLAQRVRWLKGWMQTILTHSRAPIRAARAMGGVNFLSAVSMSAGVVVGALGAPAFAVLLMLRFATGGPLGDGDLTDRIADAVMLVLGVSGLAATLLPALIGLARRRLLGLLPWLVTLPLYQALISLAAWIAVIELIRAPYRWNKTAHGFQRTSRTQPSAPVQKQ